MRVPIRKPGKYTNSKPDVHITQDKFEDLKNNLERLKKSRLRVAEEVKILSTTGDYSENAGYQMAKGRLRGINQRILDIEDQLKNAVIIRRQVSSGSVQLGNTVVLEANGKSKEYKILGSSETDPSRGIISHNSAVGSALIGRRLGEVVKVEVGSKVISYKIVGIK